MINTVTNNLIIPEVVASFALRRSPIGVWESQVFQLKWDTADDKGEPACYVQTFCYSLN